MCGGRSQLNGGSVGASGEKGNRAPRRPREAAPVVSQASPRRFVALYCTVVLTRVTFPHLFKRMRIIVVCSDEFSSFCFMPVRRELIVYVKKCRL